jgi:hypothetical protein
MSNPQALRGWRLVSVGSTPGHSHGGSSAWK